MNAIAQSLPPVSQSFGVDWFLLLGIAVIVGIVALIVWYRHKNPAGAAAAGNVVSADAMAVGKIIAEEFAKVRALIEAKTAPVTATAVTTEPAPDPGKSGQAGVFTATVTGDPAVDLPALMAQYSAK